MLPAVLRFLHCIALGRQLKLQTLHLQVIKCQSRKHSSRVLHSLQPTLLVCLRLLWCPSKHCKQRYSMSCPG